MTTAASTPQDQLPATEATQRWREELERYLTPAVFPAAQDDLQAMLLRRHAPSRLLWHLVPLSPWRRYASLEEVLEDLEMESAAPVVRQPF